MKKFHSSSPAGVAPSGLRTNHQLIGGGGGGGSRFQELWPGAFDGTSIPLCGCPPGLCWACSWDQSAFCPPHANHMLVLFSWAWVLAIESCLFYSSELGALLCSYDWSSSILPPSLSTRVWSLNLWMTAVALGPTDNRISCCLPVWIVKYEIPSYWTAPDTWHLPPTRSTRGTIKI